VETAGLFFLCLKRQNKSKHKERWLGEVKTFESDETRNVKYNKSSHKMISIRNQFMTVFLTMC
ncbi:TPA: hypothetical protein ACGAOO_001494, partial [Staphylococcus aureus]